MGIRGKQSATALSIIPEPSVDYVDRVARPEPPADLSQEESKEWRAIVARFPADWFGVETQSLLSQYCRHIISSRAVGDTIKKVQKISEKDDSDEAVLKAVKTLDKLYKMQDRETRVLSLLATKMRMSQQTTYDRKKIFKKNAPKDKKIWEDV